MYCTVISQIVIDYTWLAQLVTLVGEYQTRINIIFVGLFLLLLIHLSVNVGLTHSIDDVDLVSVVKIRLLGADVVVIVAHANSLASVQGLWDLGVNNLAVLPRHMAAIVVGLPLALGPGDVLTLLLGHLVTFDQRFVFAVVILDLLGPGLLDPPALVLWQLLAVVAILLPDLVTILIHHPGGLADLLVRLVALVLLVLFGNIPVLGLALADIPCLAFFLVDGATLLFLVWIASLAVFGITDTLLSRIADLLFCLAFYNGLH